MSLRAVPCTLEQANAFVASHHRHHDPVVGGYRFVAAVADATGLVRGVAIIGNPVGRIDHDGHTVEVRRIATDGARNACSFLLGIARRVAKDLGYARLITFTLPDEGGASLRASGWALVNDRAGGRPWSMRVGRNSDHPTGPKCRWEARLNPDVTPVWPAVEREPMPLFQEVA